jgi:Sugar diacid utilization regulator
VFADALLQHILRTSEFRTQVSEETTLPLDEYDAQHGSQLLVTLRSYVDTGFSLVKTAAALAVQPNTVRYRLQRIQQLTGRNPSVTDDLILLALGVRLNDVAARE